MADAALDRVVELRLRLVVAVHVEPLGIQAARQREVQLAARGHVGGQPLLGEQPEDGGAGERLARVDHLEALGAGPEGLDERPRAGAHVVLRVDVRRRAELRRQLHHIAAADLEPAALVQARAKGIDMRDRERRHRRAAIMKHVRHPTPAPPELGEPRRPSYALFLPEDEPVAGVVILHGAGSAKESHFDFARGCREDGIAALAYDARGHGRSDGSFGPGAIDDALAMVELLRAHAPRVALRGSSMGGFQAIHAGARDPARLRRRGDLPGAGGLPAALPALRPAARLRLRRRAPASRGSSRSTSRRRRRALGPDTALLLMHARGDEQVPYTVSEQLYAAAREPKRLLLVPGRPPPLAPARPGAAGRVAQVHPRRGPALPAASRYLSRRRPSAGF